VPPDKMPYNGQIRGHYLPTVMPPSLAERLSTPPPPLPIGTLNDADPEHHVPTMNSDYLANIPYDERMRVNWTNSVGHQFEQSWDRGFFRFGHFHCVITPRGGHEGAFYGSATPVLHRPPSPMPDQVGHEFQIHLLNEMVNPFEVGGARIILNPGQLVWALEHTVEVHGWKRSAHRPFVILVKDHNHYVLLDSGGHLYPRLVPADRLVPVQTTWTTVRLPCLLIDHPQVQEIKNSFQRD
jgi:hypothetical protein